MASSKAVLIFAVIAAAAAAPWPSNPPPCSTECSFAGSPKLFYSPEKTYVYAYSGKSRIQLRDVEGANAEMEWHSQVELTWLSPCDMAISLKNPSIGGGSGSADARFLERYPLVVAIVDGRVQETCSHQDDDVWSVNMKKGIASAFQNTLPSNSSINSGLNFTETDIIGNCSTRYEVDNQGETVVVKKLKNHRFCQDQYVNKAESPKAWHKAPLPLEESYSECKQEIKNGIYSSITCRDRNVLRPAYGSYKFVEADQHSVLRYESENSQAPQSISNIQGCTVRKTLRYDQGTMKKNPSVVTKLDETLKQVCTAVKQGVTDKAAAHVAKALYFLRHIPEEKIPETLMKIRSGEFCEAKEKLEALFLDAVAFIQEPGAVKVMVQELLSGKATGGRSALYAASFFAMPRPCLHSIEALKPLMENFQHFPKTTVAAASMVNTYCRQNPRCQEETPVRQIAENLSSKVMEKCVSSGSEEERQEALVLLKALGNMGVMSSETARPIVQCIEKEDADNSIRAAATQAFRNVQCHPEFHQITRQLVNIALDPRKGAEARIGSYLAAVRCAKYEDLKEIVNTMSKEENTQVRGFIMSHLLNVQESGAPYKEDLKYLLTTIILPSNFTSDLRKYSRNIDLSYYSPTFGLGGGMESNVIYAPGAYLPRSLNFNLTGVLGGMPFNVGDFGARFEGLESLLEDVFGPEGYLRKTPTSKIFQDISSFAKDKFGKVKEQLEGPSRSRRSIDFSAISHLFDKLYGPRRSHKQKADFYARINDQEMAFAAFGGDFKNIDVNDLISRFFDKINEIIDDVEKANIDTVRTAQFYTSYHLPTMQGKPLKIKLEGTTVAGFKFEPSGKKMIPSFSSQIDGFVGYDFHMAQVGVRMKNLLSTNAGLGFKLVPSGERGYELQVDMPEKMELLNMKSETYLFKRMKNQEDVKVIPSSVRSTRFQTKSCSTKPVSLLGVKVCYDINMPNVFRSEGLPLGPPAVAKIYLEKAESSMRGYTIKASQNSIGRRNELTLEVEAPGTSSPKKAQVKVAHLRSEDQDKLMLLVASESSGGMKMELNTKWTQPEKQLEFDAYFSPNKEFTPETKSVQAKFSLNDNGQDVKIDSAMHTLGSLKRYLDVAFEASGDLGYNEWSWIPLPRRLRRFESKIAAGRWHMISFVRKTSDAQYSSTFKLGQKGDEVIDVEGTSVTEGSSYRDMTMKNDVTAKIGRTQYKKHLSLYCTPEKMGVEYRLVRQGDSKKLVEWQTLLTRTGENYKLTLLLDLPSYIKMLDLEVSAENQGSSQYQINAVGHHGRNLILSVKGPVSGHFSSKATMVQTQLNIICLQSDLHTVSTSVNFMQDKQALAFELRNREEQIIAVEWNMATMEEQETKIDFKLMLPSMIEKKLSVIISNKVFHLSVNHLIMPKSPSPQRMKGFFDVDFENKKMLGEFAWDADRNPNKKVKGQVSLVRASSTLQDTVVQGELTYEEKTCQFKTELQLADPRNRFQGRNSMKIDFTTPARRMYKLQTVVNMQYQSSGPRADAEMILVTPDSQQYTMNSETSLEWLSGRYGMKINTKANIASPQGQQTRIEIEAKHERSASQREAYVQIHAANPSLEQPINTKLEMTNQQGQYSTKWMINMGSSGNGAMYEVTLAPEGGVQSFKAELDLKKTLELLKAVEHLISSKASGTRGSAHASQALYKVHYKHHERHSYDLSVQSPSRAMEAAFKCSNAECHCKFVPHKGVSEAKYELYAKHSHSEWTKTTRFEGRLHHPSLLREKQVDIQYKGDQQKVMGSIELDIFENPENKITGKLESTVLSEHTAVIEAQLSGKALKVNPRVTMRASYGPSDVGFDIKLQKSQSSPVIFAMSAKADMRFGRTAAASMMIEREGRKVFDVSGSVHPHQSPYCYGVRVEGKAQSSVIGSYEYSSELCKPAYSEVIIKKHGSDRMYATKVGIKGMKHVELSLSEVNPESQESRALGKVRVELASPSLLKIETKYEKDRLQSVKNAAYEAWSDLMSAVGSSSDEMAKEIFKEGSGTPSAHVAMLWKKIKNEASEIYDDLEYDYVIPKLHKIRQWARSEIVRGIADGYSKFWSQYARFQRQLAAIVYKTIKTVQSEFDDITKMIIEAVMGSARGLQTGEMPESIQKLWSQFKETSVYRTAKQEFDTLLREYPEDYQGLKQIIEKVKSSLSEDVERQRQNLMQLRKPRQIIYWIVNHLNFDRMMFKNLDKIVKNVVQNALFLSIQIEENHMQIQVPIRRPVYSLTQAVHHATMSPVPAIDTALWSFEAFFPTPADNMIWAYYSLMPQHAKYLLPPYNRTAMVVDSTEIITFDGAVLRVPHSSCKVLLAQYKSDSLIMQNERSMSSPHFFMKVSGIAVEVKPDLTATLNGRPVSSPVESEGEVRVYKTNEKIEVMTPTISLHVHRKGHAAAVEVSGWTFGKLAGLLGTYDGEMGNDRMTPSGTEASSLQELVKAWQEDQSCQTPSVSPVSPLQTPVAHMLQCYTFLGVRSRCNPVVRQEPFTEMCLASRNACNVAKAYSAICETKGVKMVFPLGC